MGACSAGLNQELLYPIVSLAQAGYLVHLISCFLGVGTSVQLDVSPCPKNRQLTATPALLLQRQWCNWDQLMKPNLEFVDPLTVPSVEHCYSSFVTTIAVLRDALVAALSSQMLLIWKKLE